MGRRCSSLWLLLQAFSQFLLVVNQARLSAANKTIRMGYLSETKARGGAINIAIEQAQNDGLLRDYNFSIAYAQTDFAGTCSAKNGTFAILQMLLTQRVDVVFGPLCSAVCVHGGYLMSYSNRPLFPEWCSDATLDDSVTYDTMARIAGNWAGLAKAFKAVADYYGWTHIVVITDDEAWKMCVYGTQPFGDIFGNNEKYTLTWMRLGSDPRDEQLDDFLQQIRARTRGTNLTVTVHRRHVSVNPPLLPEKELKWISESSCISPSAPIVCDDDHANSFQTRRCGRGGAARHGAVLLANLPVMTMTTSPQQEFPHQCARKDCPITNCSGPCKKLQKMLHELLLCREIQRL